MQIIENLGVYFLSELKSQFMGQMLLNFMGLFFL